MATRARPTRGTRGGGADTAACTIVFRNYLAQAQILARSFARHVPGGTFYLLVVDGLPRGARLDPSIRIVTAKDIDLPQFHEMCFRYNTTELSTAIKPALMSHLMKRSGCSRVIYLDPDIMIMRPLDELWEILDRSTIVLTPHILSPMPDDGHKPNEVSFLRDGTYNLGFLALRRSAEAEEMLNWWDERLRYHCRMAVAEGLFNDQKWINLVPGLAEGVGILRKPTYNVAYWNLHERRLSRRNGRYLVNGQPLAFFHFSGFNPDQPAVMSKHQTRIKVRPGTALAELLARYAKLMYRHQYRKWSQAPNGLSAFSNGIVVHPLLRQVYLKLDDRKRRRFGNPFKVNGRRSFYRWATTAPGNRLSPFLEEIYELRYDLAKAFPDVHGADRAKYLFWARETGAEEMGYDPRLVPRVRRKGAATRRTKTQEPTLALNVVGYFASEKGVGEGVRSDIRGLKSAGIPHVLNRFIDTGSVNRDRAYRKFAGDNPHPINLIHINADQIPEFIRRQGSQYLQDRYNIAYWAWELSEFPKQWCDNFQPLDEVWVPSAFTLDAVSRVSPIPVIRIPHCLPTRLPVRPWRRSRFGLPARSFVFLFIFDCHSWLERKNPQGLLRAFRQAFAPRDPALLVLKCAHATKDQLAKLQRAAGDANVKILNTVMSRTEVNTLLSLADCYVSLHRSEGFGLTMAEAMSLGKPVIATAYSGNMDFMTTANSFLVDYRLTEIQEDHGPYQKGRVWADPDPARAAEWMRFVFENRAKARAVGQRAAEDIARTLTPKPVGQLVRQRLERITLPRPEVPLASPAPAEDLTERARYEQLLVRVRDVVRSVLPAGATVIVVNKGDDQLLKLGRRHGWHFPQTANGEYAGYYPADSATAVAHLNVLREKGGRYLLLPQTAFWWLSHYLAFGQYLSQNCRTVAQVEDTCIIYDLESREQGGD